MTPINSIESPDPPMEVFLRDFAPDRIRSFAPRGTGLHRLRADEWQRLGRRLAPLAGILLLGLAVANVVVTAPVG